MKILIKGAGDLATGVAAELYEAGHQIIMTEIAVPLTVRRQVAFSKAVYDKCATVEGITARLVKDYEEACRVLEQKEIAVIVDPEALIRKCFQPDVIVDAILAKKNLGTTSADAPCVIALGPGFEAGKDCYAVIETMRGSTLGRPIYEGKAIPNTGVPGIIGGYGIERLIKASADGKMKAVAHIGDIVKKGDVLAITGEKEVYAQIDGIIRGMLQDGVTVTEGMKIGDVDPRTDPALVYLISDKSRKIGKGVKEAIRNYYYSNMGIVLLAAGMSKRYGSNKLLADVNGKPMFTHLVDLAAGYPGTEKVIVTRFPEIEAYAENAGINVVRNEHPQEGISWSLRLGLAEIRKKNPDVTGVVFAVCDQPYLEDRSMELIFEQAYQNPDRIVCAASEEGKGNPVYWGKKYFPELMNTSGDIGGKQIMKKHEEEIILCRIPKNELKDVDKVNS